MDEGHRLVVAGDAPRAGESPVSARARRSSPGAWDEDLGVFGSEVWNLPGMGASGAGCGEWYPEAVCDECGDVTFASRVCGKRTCPDCWGSWAKEAAVRTTVRLQAFRHTQPSDWRRQTAHAVVSPPEGEVRTKREYVAWRSRAAEIAEEKGFRGCAVIPHPFRATEEGKRLYRDADPDLGWWVWWRREMDGDRSLVYWSPHYHILGPTSRDMDPGEESEPFVYEFLRSVKRFTGTTDRESHEDLYGAVRYLLSHTGWPEGETFQSVTYYGTLANSVFVEDATEDWQHQKPSEGVLSALEREVEAVAGVESEEDGDGDQEAETDDCGACPVEGCGGVLIDVLDVSRYLEQSEPPPEVAERMRVARDWRLGRTLPPPGLKRPQSEEDAREAFEVLLS